MGDRMNCEVIFHTLNRKPILWPLIMISLSKFYWGVTTFVLWRIIASIIPVTFSYLCGALNLQCTQQACDIILIEVCIKSLSHQSLYQAISQKGEKEKIHREGGNKKNQKNLNKSHPVCAASTAGPNSTISIENFV